MTVTQYQQHDFHWNEALGDPEGDVLDTNTRHYSQGWFKLMMREDRERRFFQPIVICRSCKTHWGPAPAGLCPSCKMADIERVQRINREIAEQVRNSK